MMNSFFFITNEVEFQEATKKGARILATFMELDKPSQYPNSRIYRFEEGAKIAQSLIGKPIRFGANWLGKHLKKVPQIGVVEEAWQEAKKIKGIVRIWDKGIVSQLKKGIRFLFSVGGVAKFGEVVKRGANIFTRLYEAVCTHLQLLPNNPSKAGFPSAKMHEIIEINESVMLTDYNIKICDGDTCRVLSGIRDEFEEARAIEEEIVEEEIVRGVSRWLAE